MSNEAFEKWFEGVKNTTLDHEGYESFTKAVAHQAWKACKESLAESETSSRQESQEPVTLPPIDYDNDMNRHYIPIAGGWEIQTKGKGSSFRICDTKTHQRWNVEDKFLQSALTNLAYQNREATHPLKRLTDDEIWEIAKQTYKHAIGLVNHLGFANAIQDKLGVK